MDGVRRLTEKLTEGLTEGRCVGCNNRFYAELSGGFCYTCQCGGTIFEFNGEISIPVSLKLYLESQKYGIAMKKYYRKDIPHIEYYLGYSDYMDEAKRELINQLRMAGSISEEECEDTECLKQRKLFRKQLMEVIEEGNKWHMSELFLAQRFRTPLKVVRKMLNAGST